VDGMGWEEERLVGWRMEDKLWEGGELNHEL